MRALKCRENEPSTIVNLYETTKRKENAYVAAKKDERSTAKCLHVELVQSTITLFYSSFEKKLFDRIFERRTQ